MTHITEFLFTDSRKVKFGTRTCILHLHIRLGLMYLTVVKSYSVILRHAGDPKYVTTKALV